MNENEFAQIYGMLDSEKNAEKLLAVFRSLNIACKIDGESLDIGGASNLRIEFDKGINTFRSEGGIREEVLAQAKQIVSVLTQNNIKYFIEVCDDEWQEIISFGQLGRDQ